MDFFESAFSVPEEELAFELRGVRYVPWADFLLNPRRLRGSDFLMRWSQGVWSEERVKEAVNRTGRYLTVPYGPSGTAPTGDPREVELYFERLEAAGLGDLKRPDLLVFCRLHEENVRQILVALGGVEELPFTAESEPPMQELLARAVLSIECENSLWRAADMPAYGEKLRPMRRLGGKPGLPKRAVLPTVIIKDEDLAPLQRWQDSTGIPIHIWHVFYDRAYGIALDEAARLIRDGLGQRREQRFQAPGGATTTKGTYNIYYHHAYPVGVASCEPELAARHIIDRNGHILPYVHFQGGELDLSADALEVLKKAAHRS